MTPEFPPGPLRSFPNPGRRRVLEKFRLDDQIDRFEALYRRVMYGDGEGELLPIPENPVSPPAEVASGVNEP